MRAGVEPERAALFPAGSGSGGEFPPQNLVTPTGEGPKPLHLSVPRRILAKHHAVQVSGFEIERFPIVLDQREGGRVLPERFDRYFKSCVSPDLFDRFGEWQEGVFFDKQRQVTRNARHGNGLAAAVPASGIEFIPSHAMGKHNRSRGGVAEEGGGQKAIAEHELVIHVAECGVAREVQEERADGRQPLVMVAMEGRVKIGQELVALVDDGP